MEEGTLEVSQKKKLFFIYNLPLNFFIMFILVAIVQFVLAMISCSIFPHGLEQRLVGITIAVCGETMIPILVAPLPILILAGIIFTIWRLVKYHKNIESKQINKNTYLFKLIIGFIIWIGFVIQLFYIFVVLVDPAWF